MTSSRFELKLKGEYITYAILAIVFLIAAAPWMKAGLPATDDYRHHAMRFSFMQDEISQMHFSEWMPNIYGGWPFFTFYHPLFYVLSLPILFIFNIFTSLKIMTVVAYAIALLGTYYAGMLLFKDRNAALVASVAYTLSSHFLFHATVSGALPRLTALALLPLATALFIRALEEKHIKNIIMSGIGLAVVFMTHTSVAVPVITICGFYALFRAYEEKNLKPVKTGFLIAIIMAGIAAAWVIPLMTEKDQANFSDDSSVGSPLVSQSFRTFGIVKMGNDDVRSNYLGYSVMLLALFSIIFISKNRRVNLLKAGTLVSALLYFNIFNILSIAPVLSTSLSGSSAYFAGILAFNVVMLAGVGASVLIRSYRKEYLLYIILIIIAIDLYPGTTAFSYGWVEDGTTNFMNPPQLIDAWRFIRAQPGDFVVFSLVGQGAEIYHGKQEFGFDWIGCPQCVNKDVYLTHDKIWKAFTNGQKNDTLFGYFGVKYFVVPCQDKLPNKLVYSNSAVCVYENEEFRPLIDSRAVISNAKIDLDRIAFMTSSQDREQVIIKQNYMKSHWHAYVDNKETPIDVAWPDYMLITVPEGIHSVSLEYKTNWTHIFAWLITLATIILIFRAWRKQ